jgi:ABC-type nickel/cobalt efflux system permease component RcnA
MIPIAGVLLLIVVVFTVAVVVSNPAVFNLSVFGANIPVTASGVYFAGAGAMLVLILAAALLRRGVRREIRRRKQVKTLRSAVNSATRPSQEPLSGGDSTAAPTATRSGAAGAGSSAVPDSRPDLPSAGSEQADAGAEPDQVGPASRSATGEASATTREQPSTDAAERQALLEEAEELTGDRSDR